MTDLEKIKIDVKDIDSRANTCWYDIKILAKAVLLILEELTSEPETFEADGITYYKTDCSYGERAEQTEPSTEEKAECPFDDKIPCEWVCPNSTDCSWK